MMKPSVSSPDRIKVVFLRFSQREHQRIVAAAAEHGMRVTDFCRTAVRVAADALPVQRRRDHTS